MGAWSGPPWSDSKPGSGFFVKRCRSLLPGQGTHVTHMAYHLLDGI